MSEGKPQRRWPAITGRALLALAMSMVALFALDVAVVALNGEGYRHGGARYRRELAVTWGALFIVSSLFAFAQVVAMIRVARKR